MERTATELSIQAKLYQEQGKLAEAESLFKKVLEIREKKLGAEHPDTVSMIKNLTFLYLTQYRYEEAELLYKRALAIDEKVNGEEYGKREKPYTTWQN